MDNWQGIVEINLLKSWIITSLVQVNMSLEVSAVQSLTINAVIIIYS